MLQLDRGGYTAGRHANASASTHMTQLQQEHRSGTCTRHIPWPREGEGQPACTHRKGEQQRDWAPPHVGLRGGVLAITWLEPLLYAELDQKGARGVEKKKGICSMNACSVRCSRGGVHLRLGEVTRKARRRTKRRRPAQTATTT